MLCHRIRLRYVRRKSTPSRQACSEHHVYQLEQLRLSQITILFTKCAKGLSNDMTRRGLRCCQVPVPVMAISCPCKLDSTNPVSKHTAAIDTTPAPSKRVGAGAEHVGCPHFHLTYICNTLLIDAYYPDFPEHGVGNRYSEPQQLPEIQYRSRQLHRKRKRQVYPFGIVTAASRCQQGQPGATQS